jgi:hypothetical protein
MNNGKERREGGGKERDGRRGDEKRGKTITIFRSATRKIQDKGQARFARLSKLELFQFLVKKIYNSFGLQ